MKNSFNVLSLVLVVSLPVAFIMELAGTQLPVIVDSRHLFGAFMFTFLLNLAFMDYAGVAQPQLANPVTRDPRSSRAAAQSPLRLAA